MWLYKNAKVGDVKKNCKGIEEKIEYNDGFFVVKSFENNNKFVLVYYGNETPLTFDIVKQYNSLNEAKDYGNSLKLFYNPYLRKFNQNYYN